MGYMPFVANKPLQSVSRLTPRHFVCLTIGSRGDVQPYIALALRLKQDQHRVTIVTHDEFKHWIESYGIEHRQAGGDPTALMKLSAEHKMFSPGFFKESLGSFRQWLDDLLVDSWYACEDADVLIESPSTMSGIHIAEALKIPYFRAFTVGQRSRAKLTPDAMDPDNGLPTSLHGASVRNGSKLQLLYLCAL
jgi:sterol 3beta-glucosyltransferase